MKNLKKAGLIGLVVLLLALIATETFVAKSLFVLKDRVANSQPVAVGDVKYLSDQIQTLSNKVNQLESEMETKTSSNFRFDQLEGGMDSLRMDANAVPHGPDLIFDGEIFSMKQDDATVIATPCGGGPDSSEFRKRTSTTGPALVLNKITKTPKGYKLDVTFGGYRNTMDYNPEDHEYQQANSDWDMIYSGPKEEEKDLFGPIVKILRVNSDKIFVIGQRRAC